MRTRAAAVVIRTGHLLIIARRKHGREYAVLPGGGIEQGETAEQACLRELREETGLEGSAPTPLDIDVTPPGAARYFAVAVNGWDLRLGGPERDRASAEDVYEPRWAALEEIDDAGLVPAEAVRAVECAERLLREMGRAAPRAGGS